MVLNADDYTVAGEFEELSRCRGVAVVKDLGKGFITEGNGRPGTTVQGVVIFDLKTLKVTGRVKTGQLDTDAVTKHILLSTATAITRR